MKRTILNIVKWSAITFGLILLVSFAILSPGFKAILIVGLIGWAIYMWKNHWYSNIYSGERKRQGRDE